MNRGAFAALALAVALCCAPEPAHVHDPGPAPLIPAAARTSTSTVTVPDSLHLDEDKPQASAEAPAPVTPMPRSTTTAAGETAAAPVAAPAATGPVTVAGIRLVAGEDSQTVYVPTTESGSATLTLTRDAASAAPNIPTYVSTLCNGTSVYSGATNTTSAGATLVVPWSGGGCKIIAKAAQPSAKWTGTWSGVTVSVGSVEGGTGTPVTVDAAWTSRAVAGSETFTIDTPDGFVGSIYAAVTACSSEGGTSDASAQYACGQMVRRGTGSTAAITLSDASGVLARTKVTVSAEQHHAMVTLDCPRPTLGAVTLTVTHLDGSALLVHGPKTRAVGNVR